jgi:hypothetical protein
MKKTMRCFSAALLLIISHSALANDLDQQWLQLIKQDIGSRCPVSIEKFGMITTGLNGYRSEQWLAKSCDGSVEYGVAYYPKEAFPQRASPFSVTRKSSRRSVQPQP